METLKKIFQWLVYSSANPNKIALTVKAGIAFLVLFGVEQSVGDLIAQNIVGIIVNTGEIIASAGLIWGVVRKIGISFQKFTE